MNNHIYHMHLLQIEDYGQIKAWSVNQDLNLLLETDVDHITSFASIFMHGRYYINNCLFIKRIQCMYHPYTSEYVIFQLLYSFALSFQLL